MVNLSASHFFIDKGKKDKDKSKELDKSKDLDKSRDLDKSKESIKSKATEDNKDGAAEPKKPEFREAEIEDRVTLGMRIIITSRY